MTTPADDNHTHLSSEAPSDSASLQETETGTDTSFLSLDCAALAESLSSLPMHQKLNLDLEFVQLCDEAEAERGSGESDVVTNAFSSIVDLSTCTRKKDYTFDFKANEESKSRTSKSTGNMPERVQNNIHSQNIVKQDLSKVVEQIALDKRSAVSSAATSKQNAPTDEDEELDRLLANTGSPQQRTVEEGSQSLSNTSSVGRGSALKSAGEKKGSTVASTVELDDMLDELLS